MIASVPDEQRGERLVVWHKNWADTDGLVRKLQASGLPKLWLPAREDFHPLGEFPLLGSGKLDMSRLKALARDLEVAP